MTHSIWQEIKLIWGYYRSTHSLLAADKVSPDYLIARISPPTSRKFYYVLLFLLFEHSAGFSRKQDAKLAQSVCLSHCKREERKLY